MYMMVCVGGRSMGVGGRWGRQVGISRGHRPESLINKGGTGKKSALRLNK